MLDFLPSLFGFFCVLLAIGAAVGLPIFVLIQFFQIKARLHELERDVKQLQRETPVTAIVVEPEPIPVVEPASDEAPVERKKKPRRRPVEVTGPDWTMKVGGMQGVAVDPTTGVMTGGCDPRRDGYVVPA